MSGWDISHTGPHLCFNISSNLLADKLQAIEKAHKHAQKKLNIGHFVVEICVWDSSTFFLKLSLHSHSPISSPFLSFPPSSQLSFPFRNRHALSSFPILLPHVSYMQKFCYHSCCRGRTLKPKVIQLGSSWARIPISPSDPESSTTGPSCLFGVYDEDELVLGVK